MKVLFLVGFQGYETPTEELSPLSIRSTSTVYNYFLRKEFARLGVETATYHFRKLRDPARARNYVAGLDPPPADHVVCLEQRGFTAADRMVFDFYRARTPGAVCAICDHDSILGPEDYLFHAQPTRNFPPDPRSVHVDWAASPEFCWPAKEAGILNILMDHNNYSGEDRTPEILADLARLARSDFARLGAAAGFERMAVRRFVSGGLEAVDPLDVRPEQGYSRRGLPYPEACAEYRRADIFLVTKPESMGLSMIECAMSGALIVAPRGYANPYLLDELNHLIWDGGIDWDLVFAYLDARASAAAAACFNWQALASRILNQLRLHPAARRAEAA